MCILFERSFSLFEGVCPRLIPEASGGCVVR
jgi:hypothetical protein